MLVVALGGPGCERKAIPPRLPTEPGGQATAGSTDDARALLEGGRLVFEDDFERESLGDHWTTKDHVWGIVGGAVHTADARNAGLWLDIELPERARISFDARSEPRTGGKPFEGDLKCEVFAERPEHQGGYILINGGWNNQLDVIARKDEHGADRKAQPAAPVEPSRIYRWTIVRDGAAIDWYRDDQRLMRYEDPEPVKGHFFGFNDWEANVFFDNLRVYALD